MKKYLVLALFSIFLVACKSNPSTKLDMKSEVGIKGNWTITSVSFPGQEYFKVTSFNVADSQCFVGSTWKFVSNNNTGEMSLNKAGCDSYSSKITWFINKEGNLTMKLLSPGVKAKHNTSGYVFKVANQTADSFQLVDRIDVAGQVKDIVYQFNKTN